MRAMRTSMASVVLLSLVSGCVNRDTDRVQLAARIRNVELAVEEAALVSSLSGSFELVMEVGDLAAEASVVDAPPSFDLVAEGSNERIRQLDVTADTVGFPLTVDIGESVTARFTLTDDNTLESGQTEQLCSGPLAVSGRLRDSLSGDGTLSVLSAPFAPSGCAE